MSASEFRIKLETLINAEGMESWSNTPDFILAEYLVTCLEAFDRAASMRDDWYGVELRPGMRSAVNEAATAAPAAPREGTP